MAAALGGSKAGRGKDDVALSGMRKAAIFCMTLGNDKAADIFKLLSPTDVELLSKEIAITNSIEPETVEVVLSEFRGVFQAAEAAAHGGVTVAQEILEKALGPQRAKVILDRIKEQITDTGLRRLKKAGPDVLNSVLRGEHPQTIALILAHLDARQSAVVIATMESELAADVLCRVARMDKISPEMLQLVEQVLASKADLSLGQEMMLTGGPATVAKVLNLTGGTLEKQMLEAIQSKNGDIATEVKNLMFVFEDLKLLDGRAVQRLLREIDSKELALSLKAASEELKEHIFKNMSERAAAALKEELEFLGPVKVRDVEAAHIRIIEIMRSLEDAGEIIIGGRGGDEDVIA
ncbi:MAG: flagellar motor switch protein FliG [Gemmatimonadota bacterium]